MEIPKEWGKTRYDDILKEYRIPKKHLYYIVTTNDIAVIRRKIHRNTVGFRKIKDRYEFIKKNSKKKR